MKEKAIIVLGMHRSGTSALAAGLERLGASLGHNLFSTDTNNSKGYFENKDIVEFNNRLLKALKGSWDNPLLDGRKALEQVNDLNIWYDEALLILKNNFSKDKLWAIKDPRICFLLPFWQKVFSLYGLSKENIYYVNIVRNPLEVALSINKRHLSDPVKYPFGEDLEQSMFLWLSSHYQALCNLNSSNNFMLLYENILDDPQKEFSRLSKFIACDINSDNESMKEYFSSFLEKKMRHHCVEDKEINNEKYNTYYQFYHTLKKLSLLDHFSASKAQVAMKSFGDVKSALDLASPLAPLLNAEKDLIYLENKIKQLSTANDELLIANDELLTANDEHQKECDRITKTISWKVTIPLRVLQLSVELFFIMAKGFSVYLSRKGNTSMKRLAAKQELYSYHERLYKSHPRLAFVSSGFVLVIAKKIVQPAYRFMLSFFPLPDDNFYESTYQENQSFIDMKTDIKALAFYLPQFHTFPENDEWWGKGFTEWTNTEKAKPRYTNHYQPREPHDDFGYYNLTNIDTIRQQAKLAKDHGIYGLCFYHYWFSGKTLMEKPLDLLLKNKDVDINFCICWANENWTRRWDGQDDQILIGQDYSEKDKVNFIKDLKKYIDDKRYIRVNGKALILVYYPEHIVGANEMFTTWRQWARDNDIGELEIWIGRTHKFDGQSLLDKLHTVDYEFEFPPHMISDQLDVSFVRKGIVYDYRDIVKKVKASECHADNFEKPAIRTVMLGWDNSSRREKNWQAWNYFSLEQYYEWLRHVIEYTRVEFDEDRRFICINAWNEWCEGTYLEPDKKFGYASINTTSKALFDLPLKRNN